MPIFPIRHLRAQSSVEPRRGEQHRAGLERTWNYELLKEEVGAGLIHQGRYEKQFSLYTSILFELL